MDDPAERAGLGGRLGLRSGTGPAGGAAAAAGSCARALIAAAGVGVTRLLLKHCHGEAGGDLRVHACSLRSAPPWDAARLPARTICRDLRHEAHLLHIVHAHTRAPFRMAAATAAAVV